MATRLKEVDVVTIGVGWTGSILARELTKAGRRHVSLVDHISFLVMNRRGLTRAFAFDPHFKTQGFRLFEP